MDGLPRASHLRRRADLSGHEELYAVSCGHARFTVGGEAVDAPAGTCVFMPDLDPLRERPDFPL